MASYEGYEAPAVKDLGSVRELTAHKHLGKSGAHSDMFGSFNISGNWPPA